MIKFRSVFFFSFCLFISLQQISFANPLIDAISSGNMAQIQQEIASSSEEQLNATNEQGETPLHVAISKYQFETVDLLLKKGVNPSQRDFYDKTPLISAIDWARSASQHNYFRSIDYGHSQRYAAQNYDGMVRIIGRLLEAIRSGDEINSALAYANGINEEAKNDPHPALRINAIVPSDLLTLLEAAAAKARF